MFCARKSDSTHERNLEAPSKCWKGPSLLYPCVKRALRAASPGEEAQRCESATGKNIRLAAAMTLRTGHDRSVLEYQYPCFFLFRHLANSLAGAFH